MAQVDRQQWREGNLKMSGNNGSGPLRTILETAAADSGYSFKALTVLKEDSDPYRHDTPAGHRNAKWFAEQVNRFLRPTQTIHLRGMHYLISSSSDVRRPDRATLYTNDNEAWEWLTEHAAKAARWLGFVPFERIVDERNAPPEIFVPPIPPKPWVDLFSGSSIDIPIVPGGRSVLPHFLCRDFAVAQKYRIILFGEKISLQPVLLPLAQEYGTELLLPTGEATDTMIAELAARCASGRAAVVLYFSDFDPSGRQMAISVSRKLQALRDLRDPELQIEVHRIALTLSQVRRFRLPSTPLKENEQRGDRWRAVMGHEQTEIDSMIALHPASLRTIARDAIRTFYDSTLDLRLEQARRQWQEEAATRLEDHPAYVAAADTIRASLAELENAVGELENAARELEAAQSDAAAALADIEPPEVVLPEPGQAGVPPRPLFTTAEDYVTATRRLIDHKALNSGVEE